MSPIDPSNPKFLHAIYQVRNLFSGKWVPAIAIVLLPGPLHYKDLLHGVRALDVATDRPNLLHEAVLTRTLRRMVENQLLVRKEKPSAFAPSVSYALTPATRHALKAAMPLVEWLETHPELNKWTVSRPAGLIAR